MEVGLELECIGNLRQPRGPRRCQLPPLTDADDTAQPSYCCKSQLQAATYRVGDWVIGECLAGKHAQPLALAASAAAL
jgi:hypothetical protein